MQSGIIGFILGSLSTLLFAIVVGRILFKAKTAEMCGKKCKLIIDAKNEIKEVREDRNNKLSSILSKVNKL